LALVLLALALYVAVQTGINFNGVNASQTIKNDMPWHYHSKYMALSTFLIFISLFSFVTSYYEVGFMISLDSLLCFVAMVGTFVLTVITKFASNSLEETILGNPEEELKGKCAFVLP